MKRELKFRAWDGETMHYNIIPWQWDFVISRAWHRCEKSTGSGFLGSGGRTGEFLVPGIAFKEVMQFTGLEDKNGKEIYEGDIFRIEENGDGTEPDMIFYIVIVWVQEWCMFCSLLVEDEYLQYLAKGVEALDEPMFWTYTLEDTDSRKHFLCGNIFETPNLLKFQQQP